MQRRLQVVAIACLMAALSGAAAMGNEAPTSPGSNAPASFLLINASTLQGEPRLAGCDRAMSVLHARLDNTGISNLMLTAPTTSAIREGLVRFSGIRNSTRHILLFCGYASGQNGNLFALGSDETIHDDLSLNAVSVRAFSRVLGSAGGAVLLDLHPVDDVATGALSAAARSWTRDESLLGHKLARVEHLDAATLAAGLAGSQAVSVEAVLAKATPAAAPTSAVPPAPATTSPVPPHATPSSRPPTAAQPSALPPATPSGTAFGPAHPAETARSQPAVEKLKPKPPERRPALVAGQAIQRIQLALLARGLYRGQVNGLDDGETRASIRHFQAIMGHPATGQVTPAELHLLTGG